jgi:hypothetical protein
MSRRNSVKKFYAVAQGRSTGIFEEWSAVRRSTEGFSGNCYRGYASLEGAVDHLLGYGEHTRGSITVYDRKGGEHTLEEYEQAQESCDTDVDTDVEAKAGDVGLNTGSSNVDLTRPNQSSAETHLPPPPQVQDSDKRSDNTMDPAPGSSVNPNNPQAIITPIETTRQSDLNNNDEQSKDDTTKKTTMQDITTQTGTNTDSQGLSSKQNERKPAAQGTKNPPQICAYCGSDLEKLTRAVENLDKHMSTIVPQVSDIKGTVGNISTNSNLMQSNTKTIMGDIMLTQETIQKADFDGLKKSITAQLKNINTAAAAAAGPASNSLQLLEDLQRENAQFKTTMMDYNKKILEEISTTQKELDALGNYIESRLQAHPRQESSYEPAVPRAATGAENSTKQHSPKPNNDLLPPRSPPSKTYAEAARERSSPRANVTSNPWINTPRHTRTRKKGKSVLLCTDSICNDIDTERLCKNLDANITRRKTSTIEEVSKLQHAEEHDVILLHTGINNITEATCMEDIIDMAHSLVLEADRLASTTPVIISGVLPSPILELDEAIYLFNSYVQDFLWEINSKSVFYFSNDNFIRRRKIQTHFYRDNIHPSRKHGASVLSSNIIHAMITSDFGITLTKYPRNL